MSDPTDPRPARLLFFSAPFSTEPPHPGRRYVLRCRHGSRQFWAVDADAARADEDAIGQALLADHRRAVGCDCLPPAAADED